MRMYTWFSLINLIHMSAYDLFVSAIEFRTNPCQSWPVDCSFSDRKNGIQFKKCYIFTGFSYHWTCGTEKQPICLFFKKNPKLPPKTSANFSESPINQHDWDDISAIWSCFNSKVHHKSTLVHSIMLIMCNGGKDYLWGFVRNLWRRLAWRWPDAVSIIHVKTLIRPWPTKKPTY